MPRQTRALLLLIILLTATLLRAHGLLSIEHNVDQAYPIGQALNTLDRGLFPLVGQGTSVLFANPAVTGYLYLPLIALARTPIAAYLLVISLNTLGVYCAYRGVRLLFGDGAALIAAWLIAVNPWVIEYSRSTWVQSLLPCLAPLIFWLLAGVLLGSSRRLARRLFAACVALALATQTYLLAYLLVVPFGLLIEGHWRQVRAIPGATRALALGAVVFGAVTAVYLVGLLATTDPGTRLTSFAGAPARLSPEATAHALRLFTGADYALARGLEAAARDSATRQSWGVLAQIPLVAALLLGLVRAVGSLRRGTGRGAAAFALVWFAAPIALMSYVGQVVHPFYLLLTLPAGAALVGYGLTWPLTHRTPYPPPKSGLERSGDPLDGQVPPLEGERFRVRVSSVAARLYRAVLIGSLTAFGLLMAVNSARFAEATAATPGAHELGALPLRDGLRLGDAIRAHVGNGIVFADVDRWTLESLSGRAFAGFLREARAGQTPGFRILPREGGIYVAAHPVGAFTNWTIPSEVISRSTLVLGDGTSLTVDALAAAAPPSANPLTRGVRQDQPDMPILTLERAEIGGEGDTLTLTTEWGVLAEGMSVGGTQYAPFVQVFDAESGERLGVYEGLIVSGEVWRAGDRHLHTISFPRPARPYRVSVGQYDGAAGQNLILVLPDGRYEPMIDVEPGG